MTRRLSGKTVVVTAAGQGIGRATAEAFAEEGANVWATDIDEAKVQDLAGGQPRLRARGLDVTDVPGIEALAEEVGDIDVLFNCAGYVHHGTILDCDEADWDRSFDVNVKSMYQMTRAFLPAMLLRGAGNIINMASAVSSMKGKAKRCAYGATKGAVIGLTKAIATDFAPRGIRCNAICPSVVDTPSLRERLSFYEDPAEALESFRKQQPLGRMGTTQDVAMLAVFLASDESSFITGSTVLIDGGKLM